MLELGDQVMRVTIIVDIILYGKADMGVKYACLINLLLL